MRILGYILLLCGFLWLLGNVRSFSKDQYAAANIINTQFFSLDGAPVPFKVAFTALWSLYNQSKIRYGLVLPPACLMLAGGFVLGSQARKRLVVQRIYTNPPSAEIKSKLNEVRNDPGAALQPAMNVGFRRALLALMRPTVARSTYFRTREADEHSNSPGPDLVSYRRSLPITKK